MTKSLRRHSRSEFHEHSGSLREVIDVLSRSLTTESIMTPWSQVKCVEADSNRRESKARAHELMNAHQYSAVPLIRSGRVLGVYIRFDPSESPRYEGIRPEHLVDAKLGLLELIRRMRDTRKIAVGVGSAESPVGWLTYADFSKRPFRVLLFTLMAEVEYLLAQALDLAHPDGSWLNLLKGGEGETRDVRADLLRRQQEAKQWDVTMPLTTFAEIGHLIHAIPASKRALSLLGEHAGIAGRLLSIPELRNRVAHVVRPVVAGPKQISSVADQVDLMLGWTKTWSANLAVAPVGDLCDG